MSEQNCETLKTLTKKFNYQSDVVENNTMLDEQIISIKDFLQETFKNDRDALIKAVSSVSGETGIDEFEIYLWIYGEDENCETGGFFDLEKTSEEIALRKSMKQFIEQSCVTIEDRGVVTFKSANISLKGRGWYFSSNQFSDRAIKANTNYAFGNAEDFVITLNAKLKNGKILRVFVADQLGAPGIDHIEEEINANDFHSNNNIAGFSYENTKEPEISHSNTLTEDVGKASLEKKITEKLKIVFPEFFGAVSKRFVQNKPNIKIIPVQTNKPEASPTSEENESDDISAVLKNEDLVEEEMEQIEENLEPVEENVEQINEYWLTGTPGPAKFGNRYTFSPTLNLSEESNFDTNTLTFELLRNQSTIPAENQGFHFHSETGQFTFNPNFPGKEYELTILAKDGNGNQTEATKFIVKVLDRFDIEQNEYFFHGWNDEKYYQLPNTIVQSDVINIGHSRGRDNMFMRYGNAQIPLNLANKSGEIISDPNIEIYARLGDTGHFKKMDIGSDIEWRRENVDGSHDVIQMIVTYKTPDEFTETKEIYYKLGDHFGEFKIHPKNPNTEILDQTIYGEQNEYSTSGSFEIKQAGMLKIGIMRVINFDDIIVLIQRNGEDSFEEYQVNADWRKEVGQGDKVKLSIKIGTGREGRGTDHGAFLNILDLENNKSLGGLNFTIHPFESNIVSGKIKKFAQIGDNYEVHLSKNRQDDNYIIENNFNGLPPWIEIQETYDEYILTGIPQYEDIGIWNFTFNDGGRNNSVNTHNINLTVGYLNPENDGFSFEQFPFYSHPMNQ